VDLWTDWGGFELPTAIRQHLHQRAPEAAFETALMAALELGIREALLEAARRLARIDQAPRLTHEPNPEPEPEPEPELEPEPEVEVEVDTNLGFDPGL